MDDDEDVAIEHDSNIFLVEEVAHSTVVKCLHRSNALSLILVTDAAMMTCIIFSLSSS